MSSPDATTPETGLRFILGTLGGVLVAIVVAFLFGSTAGWISFVVAAPVLGIITARYGYGLWKLLGELLSLP